MRYLILPLAAMALSGALACSGNDNTNGTTGPSGETVLESVTPTVGATGVDPASPIAVRFSGPMANGMEQYVDLHQGGIGGPVVPMSCALSSDRSEVTCVPNQPLQEGSTYAIHAGGGMMDANGRPVEVEQHGMGMGGQLVTGQGMGGMHNGQPAGMMGPGWVNSGDGSLGMAFSFQTASSSEAPRPS